MDTLTFTVPCLFGLEGLAANELRRLGLDPTACDFSLEERALELVLREFPAQKNG